MAFVKIWIHIVFGTKNKERTLSKGIREQVISHIFENAKIKDIHIDAINGFDEHVHCLISLGRDQTIAFILKMIKGESAHWINKNKITRTKFEWADEYYAVSTSESQVDAVRKYIMNQEDHHKTKSFTEEYHEFMQKYGFKYLD